MESGNTYSIIAKMDEEGSFIWTKAQSTYPWSNMYINSQCKQLFTAYETNNVNQFSRIDPENGSLIHSQHYVVPLQSGKEVGIVQSED